MRRFLFLLILIWTLSTQTAVAMSVNGTVTDLSNGNPVDSARVELFSDDSDQPVTTFSDASGNWTLDLSGTSVDPSYIRRANYFIVHPNYPNPFHPHTVFPIRMDRSGQLNITVYNVLGKKVDELHQSLIPGSYQITWESKGAPGVYLVIFRSGESVMTRKMVQLHHGNGRGLLRLRRTNTRIAALTKALSQATIIISKFGYLSDTLVTTISDGQHFDCSLETVHAHATVVDLHNDVIYKVAEDGYDMSSLHHYNHTDIPRLLRGQVDVQFLALWISPTTYSTHPFQRVMDYVSAMNEQFANNSEVFQQARTATEAKAIIQSGKIAGVMAVEGGHIIEKNIDNLITLYNAGMRYMTITWNNTNEWAVSAKDPRSKTVGISDFGRRVIHTMDSLGVIIDVSHTGIKAINDILEVTTNPIIASHSGARALNDHYRNLYDDQILAIANTGGVIGVVFYPPFLASSGEVTIETVLDHIDYIVNLAGVEHVAIGSDFDGIGITPIGLEDVSKFPDLTLALLRRGYTHANVMKIMGGNTMRVFQTVCGE